MMRSLFSAVSGLRSHQNRMDVIANNVANVNTPGYKSSRVTFQDVFNQTLRGAGAPSGTTTDLLGGTNPMQVGLGVSVASIDTNHSPGNLQPTSRLTDVAIEGQGFFIVKDGERTAYTRVGNFSTDGDGVLVDYEGRKVLGWVPGADGNLPAQKTEQGLTALSINLGSNILAEETSDASFVKNLDAQSPVGTVRTTTLTAYDSLGIAHTVTVEFEKTAVDTWTYTATSVTNAASLSGSGTLVFNDQGVFDETRSTVNPISFDPTTTTGASAVSVDLNFSKVTQVAGPTTCETGVVDGYPSGTLESFTFDTQGVITGFYSNGRTKTLGQIAMANFPNPQGLMKTGKSLYVESNNSGTRQIGAAGEGGRGTLAPGSLEMSNVDLAEEFTQMIITERGFQANSRIISVSDELLQELVNLKR